MTLPVLRPSCPSQFEGDKIKQSRFIACLFPVADVNQAQAAMAETRLRFGDARHVCWAWRLGVEGDTTRSSDDGEPSGSAGRPILNQLEGHSVTDCALAVVRYFGGVKLGVGGLMRAYGGTAGKCLDRAALEEVIVFTRIDVVHDYECTSAVQAVLHQWELQAQEAEFGARVSFWIEVPRDGAAEVCKELEERTAGRVQVVMH